MKKLKSVFIKPQGFLEKYFEQDRQVLHQSFFYNENGIQSIVDIYSQVDLIKLSKKDDIMQGIFKNLNESIFEYNGLIGEKNTVKKVGLTSVFNFCKLFIFKEGEFSKTLITLTTQTDLVNFIMVLEENNFLLKMFVKNKIAKKIYFK